MVAVMDTAVADLLMYCEVLLEVKEIQFFAAHIADLCLGQANTSSFSVIKSDFDMLRSWPHRHPHRG